MATDTDFDRLVTSPEASALVSEESACLAATDAMARAMRSTDVDDAGLAARIGRTPRFVRAVLRGQRDLTVRNLGRIAHALGCVARITLVTENTASLHRILDAIREECRRQDEKWGAQRNLEPSMWLTILVEEVGEAAQATLRGLHAEYRQELIQVAAVVLQAISCLDRQEPQPKAMPRE